MEDDTIVDSVILETYHFKTRQERSDKKFNILSLSKEQIWEVVIFCLMNYVQGRYVKHEVSEIFEPIKALKGVETGTVKYILTVTVLPHYKRIKK